MAQLSAPIAWMSHKRPSADKEPFGCLRHLGACATEFRSRPAPIGAGRISDIATRQSGLQALSYPMWTCPPGWEYDPAQVLVSNPMLILIPSVRRRSPMLLHPIKDLVPPPLAARSRASLGVLGEVSLSSANILSVGRCGLISLGVPENSGPARRCNRTTSASG